VAPEVPGGRAAPRRPARAVLLEFFRREAPAIELLGALAHAKIVDRQHVGPAEREDEIHLHRPAPDAARGRKALDDLFVAEPHKLARFGNDAFEALLRNVLDRGDLMTRQLRAAQ